MINNLNFSAKEIANIVGGELIGEDVVIKKISIDSREKSNGEHCFLAINGEKFDGADYIDEAIANGASLVITQQKKRHPVSVILVGNTKTALGVLAKRHKGKTKVIGVTGSYGKTCVKDMIISVLGEKYSVTGTPLNYNNEIGVPMTLLSTQNEDFCVVEMGMRARGEIEWLSYISEPDLSVITSSGTSHIELLGSTQNVFKAKTEILLHTKNCCVLPSTKDFFEYECGNLKKIYVGNGGDYCIEEKRQHEDTVTFKINGCEFSINSTYSHNADNALFAYATGKYYGLDDEKIKVGLKKWRQRENRGSAFVYKGIKIINDCYNASYESVLSAIHSLSNHKVKNGQLAVLLGDMLELGNCAEQFHYNVGIACKENGISHLFAIGEHAQEYIKGFGGGTQLEFGGNIAARVINELRAGDVLLIKASHAMGFEKIIEDMREE